MDKTKNIVGALKTMYLSFTLLLLWSLFTFNIFAQGDVPRIKHLTTEDGLSQATINDLIKDSSGFVWIATEDGLNRFDGKEFKHYKHSESDSTSITGNVLNKLCEDKNGNIWVGTIGNGLNYYDRKANIFKRIQLEYAYDTETISDILIEDNGIIWVATRTSGLHRLKPTGEGSYLQQNFLPGQRLGAISMDKRGKLWVGSFDGQVYTFEFSRNNKLHARKEIELEGYVQAFYHTERQVLIGCDFGLYIYNLKDQQSSLFELEKEDRNPTKHVVTFLREDSSKVWVGTGNGMYRLDLSKMEVDNKITYEEEDGSGLTTSTVQALLRLTANQILVGTAGFLNLLDFSEPYFKNISKNKRGKYLLNDNVVYSILKDGNNLWIGTTDGGLNLIRNGESYHFMEDLDNLESISGSAVLDIAKDDKNERLWLATTRGLSMIDLRDFDPEHPKFKVFHHNPLNPNSINMDYLTSVALDGNGAVWGGTYGNGVFRLEMIEDTKAEIERFEREAGNTNSLANDFIHCIEVDRENTIWIGSEGGLIKLQFIDEINGGPSFINYRKTSKEKKSLSNNSVLDVTLDHKNRLWVATRHGLNLYLGNNEFVSWTEQKEFSNTVIFNVQDDVSGNLWLGTNDGIVKFNPEEKSFKRYGLEDGIQGTEFNIGSKFRDSAGNIYLGGINGLTYFHPKDLEKIDVPQPLYFSKLRIKDELINPGNSSKNLLKQSLANTGKLEFKYNQFPFYLQFSSIDFRLEKKVNYGYKLLPTDKEWNMLTDPEIQFLNLPPGNHTLLVNGFSRGKVWEQTPLKMNLLILPPWWASWWAYTVYALLIGTLAFWFYRFQLSRKLAVSENLRLKEVNQLKSSLYTNITHEFRTPLTVILGMADSLKSALESKQLDTTKESLEMIDRNGKNLLRLVNEMLDLAKLESGNLQLQSVQADVAPFIKYICESFHSMAKASQIDLVVYPEIDELVMDFDTNKLTAIISNLLSNAIKFTLPGGKIVVHLNKITKNEKEHFFIRVKDDGLGISEEAMPHIFNRFYQADASTSRKGEGTGIGLALTKEFVGLMGGSITAKSTQGQGSEFNIHLPITKNAPKSADVRPPTELALYGGAELPIPFEETLESDTQLPILLIIEDNMDVAHYLKTCLKGKYETLHAADGIIGIETAYEKVPDIIICDVMMPGKDGYEVCTTLKSDERTDHIPIVMLTAKVTQQDRITGLSHGADAYLAKPFNKVELFTRLDQLILLRKKMVHKFEREGFGQFLKVRAENPEAKFLKKAVKIIHEEMGDHSFGSRHLARQLSMSESQIYRKLKAITGKSTAIFIRSVRLQKAKDLIQTTHGNISEVAYDVGFNDPSWFSRAFKEEFGFSPSEISK